MNAIKKFIYWLIELIRSLFTKKKKVVKKTSLSMQEKESINGNKKVGLTPAASNDTMPGYFICGPDGKNILIDNINSLKNKLFSDISSYKKDEVEKLIKYLNQNEILSKEDAMLIGNYFDKGDKNGLNKFIDKYNDDSQKAIISAYDRVTEKENLFTNFNRELETISDVIDEEEISFLTRDKLIDEEDKLLNKKNIFDETDDITSFKERFYDVIKGYDDTIISEIKKDYKRVNYVTLANVIIDKNIKRFEELEKDFKNHRFNVSYYEREINKIKSQLESLRNVKNKAIVGEELERLKKELYTKSKDKYDVLYNDEVFLNIDKQCDDLLKNINTKVVDIKKEVKEEKKDKKKEKEKEELIKIIKRFQDMNLAHEIIMLSLSIEDEKLKKDEDSIIEYAMKAYEKYQNGINGEFNYPKNKERTELVIFYNDLNRTISKIQKADFIPIEHINFRVNDLVEAVEYKKSELNTYLRNRYNYEFDDTKIDEKLNGLKPPVEKAHVKVKNMNDNKENK